MAVLPREIQDKAREAWRIRFGVAGRLEFEPLIIGGHFEKWRVRETASGHWLEFQIHHHRLRIIAGDTTS